MKKRMVVDDIFRKYGKKIEREMGRSGKTESGLSKEPSREYKEFKKEALPNLSRYEKWCKTLGKIISLKIAKKDRERIQKQLDIAHLEVSPSESVGLAIVSFLIVFIVGILLSIEIFLLKGGNLDNISEMFPYLFLFLFIIAALFVFYFLYNMPFRLANRWRLKASAQMVPCILYIVVYMKHTSNLERAIRFASEHLQIPLALDFKKIFWDIETGKHSTIKDSLDAYLETWREYSPEFIESFHLIESSLYEPSETRRVQILEKALEVMLDGVYDKMLRYSREIRAPLTNVYMLGIVLPTLGLALLPLASTLLGGLVKWYHVFLLFNLIVPFFVFYLTNEILLKRPGGYGESDVLEMNPYYRKYRSKKPYLKAFLICLPIFLIGILPFLFQYTALPKTLGLQKDYDLDQFGISFMQGKVFDFKNIGSEEEPVLVGPFGIVALILSLFIPLSIALFFSLSYKLKTKELIKARKQNKRLENEFASSLFQLGNRLGDNIPAEIAFGRIAESTKGQVTENFFKTVNMNIQNGMSVEEAIFNNKRGAIIFYPSSLIATSMRILIESVKKGLQIAARSLMSISEYVKSIRKINERLRDLLAEVVSDMKSNMTFLAPLLAGVIIGLAGMITLILNRLTILMQGMTSEEITEMANIGTITQLFSIEQMIPPYFLQVAIGIYLIQIIFILTSALVTIDSGSDKLKRDYDIGRNLTRGISLYTIIALASIILLALISIAVFSSFV